MGPVGPQLSFPHIRSSFRPHREHGGAYADAEDAHGRRESRKLVKPGRFGVQRPEVSFLLHSFFSSANAHRGSLGSFVPTTHDPPAHQPTQAATVCTLLHYTKYARPMVTTAGQLPGW